jgi:peptidyl-tRNA hydrolase
MVKKKDFLAGIADLLPEGLDEALIGKIATMLSGKINEEVAKATEEQTRKTVSFIRGQIDRLKEHALKELELENETFRNAQLFETVRSMFAVELTPDDEINGANVLASMNETQEQKIDVLVGEVDRLLQENIRLRGAGKILSDKNKVLATNLETLTESVGKLQAGVTNKTKHMSDSAVVVSEQNFKIKEQPKTEKTEEKKTEAINEWLTSDVQKAVRELNKSKN